MKIRAITIILSLLTVFSIAAGGYLYYRTEKKIILEEVNKQSEWHVQLMTHLLENQVSSKLKAVKGLAGHIEIQQLLRRESQENLKDTNWTLDNFKASFDATEAYVMDRLGNTVASSNRNTPDSFVGKNYGFRPYFKNALLGSPSVYMALGRTTGKRGIYFSHPVYSEGENSPTGVAVMKIPAENLEHHILNLHFDLPGMVAMLIGPHGTIFMSDKKEYVMQALEKISEARGKTLINSRQFGGKPLEWSGFTLKGNGVAAHLSGHEYIISQKELSFLPGWKIIHLFDTGLADQLLGESLPFSVGWISVTVFMFCLLVFFLYRLAHLELVRRETTEKSLEENKNFLRSLLEAMPIPVFYKDTQGSYQGFNRAFETFFGKSKEELVGKSVFEINPEELARIYLTKDNELFESGGVQRYESEVQNAKDERRNVIFDKSVYKNNNDQTIGLIGTVLDITDRKQAEIEREKLIDELKKALSEIKTLQGFVPICSSCKKIRNDKGYWDLLESYIEKHSEAKFSHSMCPDCSDKLYGDEPWYKNMKNKKEMN